MSLKTDNLFIEFMGNGDPSGIATTKAKYYIITDTIEYYLIDVETLKKVCLNYNDQIKTTKSGSTAGYLLNKNIIFKISIHL